MWPVLGVVCTAAVIVAGCRPSENQRNEPDQVISTAHNECTRNPRLWCAGEYRGLKVGASTGADMIRLLASPARSDTMPPSPVDDSSHIEIWHHYENTDIPGELVVATDSRSDRVMSIQVRPRGLGRDELIRKLGNDYVTTRYDTDDCLSDGESAPLYESPEGEVVVLEYRKRGTAIYLTEEGNVDHLVFVSGPLGSASSRCKAAEPL